MTYALHESMAALEVETSGYVSFPDARGRLPSPDPFVQFTGLIDIIRHANDTNDDATGMAAEQRMRELVDANPGLLGLLD